MSVTDLPAVNATFNAISAVLLTMGYINIRRGAREAHKRCMLAALVSSALFLTCYLVYHWQVGSKPYPGGGVLRVVYLTILFTHVVLAAGILPLILMTTARGLRGDFGRHIRVAISM